MDHENLDLEIRAWLGRYVRGEIGLRSFQDWFVPATWNVHAVGNPLAPSLAYQIDALIAQYSDGSLTEGRLRQRLDRYVEIYRFVYGQERDAPRVSLSDRPSIQDQVVAVGI